MNEITHPIEPEELMAYLDGELSADRIAAASEHLDECRACRETLDGLRGVSQAIRSWHVESTDPRVPPAVASALKGHAEQQERSKVVPQNKWRSLRWPALAWAAGFAACVAILISLSIPNLQRTRMPTPMAKEVAQTSVQAELTAPSAGPVSAPLDKGQLGRLTEFTKLQAASPASLGANSSAALATVPTQLGAREDEDKSATKTAALGPMIIRTAEVSLTAKDFDEARAGMESVLKRHRGYIADLKVGSSAGSARTLTGTLRVPADQLDSTLNQLKALGRVESESQGGQDVTSQYVDLQARLANARTTEKRLSDILTQRAGKLSDVLEVEREVDRVRGEIEQMEAERKNMSNQVAFATLTVRIAEDYKAQLEVVPPATSTRLSNAAVSGYRTMVDGVVDVLLFTLSSGPRLLLWGAVLFLPARFAWKTLRRHWAQ